MSVKKPTMMAGSGEGMELMRVGAGGAISALSHAYNTTAPLDKPPSWQTFYEETAATILSSDADSDDDTKVDRLSIPHLKQSCLLEMFLIC